MKLQAQSVIQKSKNTIAIIGKCDWSWNYSNPILGILDDRVRKRHKTIAHSISLCRIKRCIYNWKDMAKNRNKIRNVVKSGMRRFK